MGNYFLEIRHLKTFLEMYEKCLIQSCEMNVTSFLMLLVMEQIGAMCILKNMVNSWDAN